MDRHWIPICCRTAADGVSAIAVGHGIIRLTGILSNPHGYTNAHKKSNTQTLAHTHRLLIWSQGFIIWPLVFTWRHDSYFRLSRGGLLMQPRQQGLYCPSKWWNGVGKRREGLSLCCFSQRYPCLSHSQAHLMCCI